MEIVIFMILGFVVVSLFMVIFPSFGAWIAGGTKGVKEHNKNKNGN